MGNHKSKSNDRIPVKYHESQGIIILSKIKTTAQNRKIVFTRISALLIAHVAFFNCTFQFYHFTNNCPLVYVLITTINVFKILHQICQDDNRPCSQRATSTAIDKEIDAFYEKIRPIIMPHIPRHSIVVIAGDFKAKVDRESAIWKGTIGEFGSDGTKFCTTNDLKIMNTLLKQKKPHRKRTWTIIGHCPMERHIP